MKITKTDKEWREQLTPEAYNVTRQNGTEPPFSGALYDNKEDGVYKCICCDTPLFESDTKFDSGTGWPSYYEALEDTITEVKDMSHGMIRIDVRCSSCDAHLGHVFKDGPNPTGLRYCINSVSLDFEEK